MRLLRTNLTEKDIDGGLKERLAQAVFDHIPVGVGSQVRVGGCGVRGCIGMQAHVVEECFDFDKMIISMPKV